MSRLILPRRALLKAGAAALITSPAIIGKAAAQLSGGLMFPGPGTAHSTGAAWTPASVATSFWYKADSSVFSDAGVTPATNGVAVQQWNDLSGNGRHLTQATAGNRPVFTTGVLNSLPGIHWSNTNFATTDSVMVTSTFTVAQPLTTVVVFKNNGGTIGSIGGNGSFGLLLDGDLAQSAANRMIMFIGRTDTANNASYYAGTTSINAGVTFGASSYHYAVIFNGATSSSDINSTTTSGQNPGSFGVVNGISVGSTTSTNQIDAFLCEMFCIPSTTQLANALGYVSSKWGV